MLEIRDIHVYRGQTYVLQGVSLAINQGEIVALIGANEAGKTSMLRTVSGLLKTKRGRIFYQPREDGEKIDISYDNIIISTRYKENKANDSLFEELKGNVQEIYKIGDCMQVRNIKEAIWSANEVSRTI